MTHAFALSLSAVHSASIADEPEPAAVDEPDPDEPDEPEPAAPAEAEPDDPDPPELVDAVVPPAWVGSVLSVPGTSIARPSHAAKNPTARARVRLRMSRKIATPATMRKSFDHSPGAV